MSASRTLLRKQTKERVTLPNGVVVVADRIPRGRRIKRGFRNGRVLLTHWFVGLNGVRRRTLHATKGWRLREVAMSELKARAAAVQANPFMIAA